jgi:methylated-DNA-[protein]-cysteine S-methyltransferase
MSENGEHDQRGEAIVSGTAEATRTIEEMGFAKMASQKTHKRHVYKRMTSPVGTLTLAATDDGLAAILWENDRPGRVPLNVVAEADGHPVLVETERQLKEYFAGRRRQFALKLDFAGTEFQRSVWSALLTIPFGETRSYAQIAEQVGRPGAARAVGAANGRNPISIVAPCHRVVGSSGALTGFAGGLETKAQLLAFEGATPGADQDRLWTTSPATLFRELPEEAVGVPGRPGSIVRDAL